MKLTLQIKLIPSDEQAIMLKKTFSVFNEACNTISQIAWERRVFNQFSLHKEVYHPIKGTYSLPSQLVIRAISKVADAYKLDRKNRDVSVNSELSRMTVVYFPTIPKEVSAPFRLLMGVRR